MKDFFTKLGRWFVIAVLHGLAVMIIKDLATQCDRNRVEQSAPVVAKESVTSDFAWADSVSAITGKAYGPYFYDPSWPIEYTADYDTMGAFFGTDLSNCTLFVPKGSVVAYRQSPGWKMFNWIIGF